MLDFGIEIECLVPVSRRVVATAIAAAGVPCYDAGYSHAFEATKWKVVSDSSISGSGEGMELVSPPLNETGFNQIETVSRILLGLGATVNRTCGLHVHIGARSHSVATLKKLAALYIEHEPVIDQLLPNSRRGSANNYCKSIRSADLHRLSAATSVNAISSAVQGDEPYSSRFVKLNYKSYWRHGTVEFRHHSGTVDAAKIIKWIVFCSKLVETAAKEADQPINVPGNAPSHYSTYWQRGRRTRAIFNLLTRPEGATAEEIRLALGVRSRPNVRWHLNNAGGQAETRALTRVGRRGRHEIFKLQHVFQPTAVAPTQPPTLEGLYEKLGLSDEDKQFWAARAAHLAGAALEHNP